MVNVSAFVNLTVTLRVCNNNNRILKSTYPNGCQCICKPETYNLFPVYAQQCAHLPNANCVNMEWSTRLTTTAVKSASANLTVSVSLSANTMVSVCL